MRDISSKTKVLIVSFDKVQAKGLQNLFYSDQNVLNISIYQDSGTSGIEECGRGTGLGHNINVPLLMQTNDDDFKVVFDSLVLPIANEFEPEIILLSAGLDPFYEQIAPECYGWLTKELSNICDGKMIVAFEGRQYYQEDNPVLSYIALSTSTIVKSLIFRNEAPFMNRQATMCSELQQRIALVTKTQSKYWTCLQRTQETEELIQSDENLENDLEKMTVISQEHSQQQLMSEDEAIDVD